MSYVHIKPLSNALTNEAIATAKQSQQQTKQLNIFTNFDLLRVRAFHFHNAILPPNTHVFH
jgi:hypothetical protein